jgi:DNA-binding transcriptional LysR family regulator
VIVLDLTRLRSFLEVAERGTVAAASEALGYTPPAVSQHVAKLERSLDVLLFERIGGQLRLTHAGRALVPVARELVGLAVRAAEVVHAPPPRPRVVVAGFASAIAALVLPRLDRLAEQASVEIVEAEDASALRELRLGHVDVALVQEYPGDEARRDPRLAYTPAAHDELRLVLPPGLPATTTVADLGDTPWLINGSGTRCEAATREILRRAGVDPVVGGTVSDSHVLLRLVAAGHGVTIVPDLLLVGLDGMVTVATEPLGTTRTLLAVTRPQPGTSTQSLLATLLG